MGDMYEKERARSDTIAIYSQWAQKDFKNPSTFSYFKVFLLWVSLTFFLFVNSLCSSHLRAVTHATVS